MAANGGRSSLCPHSKAAPAQTALGQGLFFGICIALCTTTLGDRDHIGDYDLLYGVRHESRWFSCSKCCCVPNTHPMGTPRPCRRSRAQEQPPASPATRPTQGRGAPASRAAKPPTKSTKTMQEMGQPTLDSVLEGPL